MSFTIHASTNPETRGKGQCFTVETKGAGNSVMFDEFDTKPGISVSLANHTRLVQADETDEGCVLRFVNYGVELTLIIPQSLRYLLNTIDLLNTPDVEPGSGPTHVIR